MGRAARVCRATGDTAYLEDAETFFSAYQYSPESIFAEDLLVDWNNNYFNSALMLAQITDREQYHYVVQGLPQVLDLLLLWRLR